MNKNTQKQKKQQLKILLKRVLLQMGGKLQQVINTLERAKKLIY